MVKYGAIHDVLTYRAQVGPGGQLGRFNPSGRCVHGGVRTTDIRLIDGRGRPCGMLPADADLILQIDAGIVEGHDQSMRGLIVELSLSTDEGIPLVHVMNADDPGLELPSVTSCTLTATIPGPVLAPGRYRVSISIGVPGMLHDDEVRDCFEFEIQPPIRSWRPAALQPGKGLTCRFATWAVSAVAQPAHPVTR